MPAAAGQIIRATFPAIADGALIENVLHFREVIDAETDDAINISLEAFRHLLITIHPAAYVMSQVQWKRMTPIPLDTQFAPQTTQAEGSGSGGLINNTVACVYTLRTGTSGKTHRGRMYHGGLNQDSVVSNRLSAGGLTACNTMIASIIARWGTDGTDPTLRLGIYSRSIGGSDPMTVAGWQQVSQIVPQIILGNQRRRRVGVGA